MYEEEGKPDSSLLLTETHIDWLMEIILSAMKDYAKSPAYYGYPPNATILATDIRDALKFKLQAQLAKCEAHYQQEITTLLDEIEGLVQWLDDNNDLKWKSLKSTSHSSEHCGLGIPIEKWQTFRQALRARYENHE